jgi:hypothetical protein
MYNELWTNVIHISSGGVVMPNKGFFTQGLVILLKETVPIERIEKVLAEEFDITRKVEESPDWAYGGPSVVISYRPEVNGYISVDVVSRPWPDEMGNAQEENVIFGAWAMGYFGPFAFPGGLERAAQQSWDYEEGQKAAKEHKAFIRIRSSYLFGATSPETPVLPRNYDPFQELLHMTRIAYKLLDLSETLCLFNPNGECLASDELIDTVLKRYKESGMPPLEVWTGIRLYNLQEDNQWLVMDTVGMQQLDSIDHEAFFHKKYYNPGDVANFLRSLSAYVLKNGPIIKDGDILKGPGEITWQARLIDKGISVPPREVLRWFPMDGREKPADLKNESGNDSIKSNSDNEGNININ